MDNIQEILKSEEAVWVFDHNITWEDDIWKADPFDAETVHEDARARFANTLSSLTSSAPAAQSRILMFQGQSGAGKTHLVRALRTETHKEAKGYFGYAQMTPDVSDYADYFLRRLINSLEKPYSPDELTVNGLMRLSNHLVEGAGVLSASELEALRETELEADDLATLVSDLADQVVISDLFAEQELDINIVRALLYLQRCDPRIDQRIRQYLYGRSLNEISSRSVAALDPNEGQGRAFEIIESLGHIMAKVDGAALIFCIDQVEDLRFYDDPEERFQKACRDLIQIANRVPTALILISCLDDFYFEMREYLPQSFIDRIEKAGPILLRGARTSGEAELILDKRLSYIASTQPTDTDGEDLRAQKIFGAEFIDEIAGLSTRRLLEAAEAKRREICHEDPSPSYSSASSTGTDDNLDIGMVNAIQQRWERFVLEYQAEIPGEDDAFIDVLTKALHLTREETDRIAQLRTDTVPWLDGLTATDLSVTQDNGQGFDTRLFLCNRRSQGGGLKRQIEKVMKSADGKAPLILRASEFPRNQRSATVECLREFESTGGRWLVVPPYEWERMVALQAFRARHPHEAGFGGWLKAAQILRDLPSIQKLLRLDEVSNQNIQHHVNAPGANLTNTKDVAVVANGDPLAVSPHEANTTIPAQPAPTMSAPVPATPQTVEPEQSALPGQHTPDQSDGIEKPNPLSSIAAQMAKASSDGKELTSATSKRVGNIQLLDVHSPDDAAITSAPIGKNKTADTKTAARPHDLDGPPHEVWRSLTSRLFGKKPPTPEPVYHPAGLRSSFEPPEGDEVAAESGDDPQQTDADENLDETASQSAPQETEPPLDPKEIIQVGRVLGTADDKVAFSVRTLKRHAAVLGGSGSGKTTLALSIIEQLLMRDIPIILIDRKGDLSSYANSDVWADQPGDTPERKAQRAQLREKIDVAVYTPGQVSGRPISITLLPTGIADLPVHEQQQLANVSAAALSDMLHLGNSATHQRQGGILTVGLRQLGAMSAREVTLADLIALLEDDYTELVDETQRMDPSGKLRRDLVAQLDSLRHRNWALFEGGGEPLLMDSLLGQGKKNNPDKTRLSIIYTGFLGDNENILFWVAQFLSEALRFCQRNPNEDLQAVIMFDEADLYIPANSKPATKEPLESLLKRARSAGIGLMLATQSPGDLDYKSRDQITSWFIGKVREDTALKKLKAAFSSETGIDPASALPNQKVGEFHLIQEGVLKPIKSDLSLVVAEQVPFDRIEQLSTTTVGKKKPKRQLGFDFG